MEKEELKQEIIEMVSSIENKDTIEIIYGIVHRGYKEEKTGG